MSIFNQYTLTVVGIMFEICGSFILTLEAFSPKWIDKTLGKFVHFSNWTRSNVIRVLAFSLVLVLPFILAPIFNSRALFYMLLPIALFIIIITTLIDDAAKLKQWTLASINNKRIGPVGFILILIGNLLQLISTVIQIE